MNLKCLLDVICDPVAINAGLAVFFGLLARSTAVSEWHWAFNSCGKNLSLPVASAILWGLAIIFAVTAFTTYLLPSNHLPTGVTEKQGSSELMMAFVGVAFAMFTGIAVFMLSDSRKELEKGLEMVECAQKDWRKQAEELSNQWKELPGYLDLLRTGAIAHTSIRYAFAIANQSGGKCARDISRDILMCNIIRKVVDHATVEEIQRDEHIAISELSNMCENSAAFGALANREWQPVRLYFQALHQELRKSGLSTSKAAVLLGQALAALDGRTVN